MPNPLGEGLLLVKAPAALTSIASGSPVDVKFDAKGALFPEDDFNAYEVRVAVEIRNANTNVLVDGDRVEIALLTKTDGSVEFNLAFDKQFMLADGWYYAIGQLNARPTSGPDAGKVTVFSNDYTTFKIGAPLENIAFATAPVLSPSMTEIAIDEVTYVSAKAVANVLDNPDGSRFKLRHTAELLDSDGNVVEKFSDESEEFRKAGDAAFEIVMFKPFQPKKLGRWTVRVTSAAVKNAAGSE